MPGTNDFQPVATAGGANVVTQAEYLALTSLLADGLTSGIVNSAQFNKMIRQATFVAAAVAQLVANSGANATDDGNLAAFVANLQQTMGASVVGTARNLRASLTAASTSVTFTADEIIVETALGGAPFRLAAFNKTLNVSTTGAGGMDTGAAPASGYVAIYAIYNPTTSTASILATNATAAAAPNVYGGANMPAGYTLSGLISVWPTTGSSQLVGGYQEDRGFSYAAVLQVLGAAGISSTLTNLGVAAAIPKNAKRTKGYLQIANVATTNSYGFAVAADTSGYSYEYMQAYVQPGGSYGASMPFDIPVSTPQTLAYQQVGTNTSGTYVIQINGYSI